MPPDPPFHESADRPWPPTTPLDAEVVAGGARLVVDLRGGGPPGPPPGGPPLPPPPPFHESADRPWPPTTPLDAEVVAGGARLVVDLRGGGLRELVVGDWHVLDGYPAGTVPAGRRGGVLLPWPNRLRGGRWRWRGGGPPPGGGGPGAPPPPRGPGVGAPGSGRQG